MEYKERTAPFHDIDLAYIIQHIGESFAKNADFAGDFLRSIKEMIRLGKTGHFEFGEAMTVGTLTWNEFIDEKRGSGFVGECLWVVRKKELEASLKCFLLILRDFAVHPDDFHDRIEKRVGKEAVPFARNASEVHNFAEYLCAGIVSILVEAFSRLEAEKQVLRIANAFERQSGP